MKILIINGPNLGQLGLRQPEIYGSVNFNDFLDTLRDKFPAVEIGYFQSELEGELIASIHKTEADGIIINAGGYTHTSVALADALASIKIPVVEVHISNILARESFRHTSLLAPHCKGVITGFGLVGYELAMNYLTRS
jgi:3-dehydroquinate dehydratase-2